MSTLLALGTQPLTMTSREIAELTGKRHDHVIRDARNMLIGLYGEKEVAQGLPDKDLFEVFCDRMGWGIASPKLGNQRVAGVQVTRDSRGFVSEIALDYNHSMTLVSGYNVKLRKLIVDRWQALEASEAVSPSVPALNLRQPAQMLAVAMQLAEMVQEQQAQLTAQAPKVKFAEAVGASEDLQAVAAVAKVIGTGERRLFAWMRDNGILTATNLPLQHHLDAGRFRVVERTWKDGEGKDHIRVKTMVTGKGVTYLQQRWAKAHEAADAAH